LRRREMNKTNKAFASLVIGLIFLLIIAISFTFIVDEREQAIILQFGQYIRTIEEPGLYLRIPFIQVVETMEARVMIGDAPPTEFISLDKERLVIDTYTRWRIVNPHLFFTTVRDEHGAEIRINNVAISKLREMIASYNLWDIIGVQREPIMQAVGSHVNEVASKEFGIKVIDVRMKRVDLPEGVQEAVFARMRAERERIAKEHRAKGEEAAMQIRAEADRQVTVLLAEAEKQNRILRGEGEARAAAIYAAAFNQHPEFYSFSRVLQAYERFLNENSTLILGTDTELFRLLENMRTR
jgi:membrane protease subunit HflC